MSYAVKGRVEFKDETVIVLKPDHVSLGKCVLCNNFVRRYSSVNDLEIESMLKDGCVFKGYKKVKTVSVEEEAFSNMHFVLLLSNSNSVDDEVKQVCIRRIAKVRIPMEGLGTTHEVVTSSNASSVIIIIDRKNKKIFLSHFKKQTMKQIVIPIDEQHRGLWKFELVSDVLYIDNSELQFVNFNTEVPFYRKIHLGYGQVALFYSNDMVALAQKNGKKSESPEAATIVCDMLRENIHHKQVLVEKELLTLLLESTISVLHIKNKFIWLVFNGSEIKVFNTSGFVNDLIEITTLNVLDLFVNCDSASYKGVCYCRNTQQAYIVYARTIHEEVSSSIVGLNLQTLKISCVLDLQLTLNRRPEIKIHVSPIGHKLFVQETFDDKLIFFQVFKLLPADLKLQNIIKQYIWENLSEDALLNRFLPKDLKAELEEGF